MYSPTTVYIIGDSKSQQNNPITQMYGQFMLGFVIDRDTDIIVNCGSSVIMKCTYDFLDDLFKGRNMLTDGDAIRREIENRYFGSSQRAIIVAFKEAQRRYRLFKQGVRGEHLTKQEDLNRNC